MDCPPVCYNVMTDSNEYSLIRLSHNDIVQLKVIGEIYINKKRYHAVDDFVYDETQTQVGKIIQQNIIAWY